MNKLLLASVTEEENYILRRKLEPLTEELGALQFISVRPQGLISAADSSMSLAILNTLSYSRNHRVTLLALRASGYNGPVLVCAKAESREMIKELQAMRSTVFLEKPFEPKDLQGIVRKFIKAYNVSQQYHRRYTTAMSTEVEFGDKKATGTLLNLSRGGAYFEFAKMAPVKNGDELKLHLNLNQVRRSYAMPVRVIWTTPIGFSGGFGVGVEFIGRGETQKLTFGRL
jgi:hypothetical protein